MLRCLVQHCLFILLPEEKFSTHSSLFLADRVDCCLRAACLLYLFTVQVPFYAGCNYPTSAGLLQGVGDTSPARGRPVANLIMLCLLCVCFPVPFVSLSEVPTFG
jgi:hypothetical protein